MRKVLVCLFLVACLAVSSLARAASSEPDLEKRAKKMGILMPDGPAIPVEWGVGVVGHDGSLGPAVALGAFVPLDSDRFFPGAWFDAWFTKDAKGAFIGQGLFLGLADYVTFKAQKTTLSEQGVVLGLNAYAGVRYIDPDNGASFLAPALHLGLGASGHYAGRSLFAEIFCETSLRGGPVWGGIVSIPF